MAVEELDAVLKHLPRHHLFAEIPAALRGWLLPIDWDRHLLWELALPRRRLGLEELRWHFDLPWWRREGVWFQVTPTEFLAHPEAHPEHADRVATADLSYPLHVVLRHRRWLILDGIHRLAKAETLGLTDVAVSTLAPADIAKIARHQAIPADPAYVPRAVIAGQSPGAGDGGRQPNSVVPLVGRRRGDR